MHWVDRPVYLYPPKAPHHAHLCPYSNKAKVCKIQRFCAVQRFVWSRKREFCEKVWNFQETNYYMTVIMNQMCSMHPWMLTEDQCVHSFRSSQVWCDILANSLQRKKTFIQNLEIFCSLIFKKRPPNPIGMLLKNDVKFIKNAHWYILTVLF